MRHFLVMTIDIGGERKVLTCDYYFLEKAEIKGKF
jgi:hypothetical protein